jgi:hypothetical protein
MTTGALAGVGGKIAGKITDAKTREALPVANVIISARWDRGQEVKAQNIMGGASDANGEYFILGVPPGEYTVEAHLVGYVTGAVKHVIVNIDRSTRVDVDLNSTSVEVSEVVVTASREKIRGDIAYSA